MFFPYLAYSTPVSLQFFVCSLVHINVRRCAESCKRDNYSADLKLRVTPWSGVNVVQEGFSILS